MTKPYTAQPILGFLPEAMRKQCAFILLRLALVVSLVSAVSGHAFTQNQKGSSAKGGYVWLEDCDVYRSGSNKLFLNSEAFAWIGNEEDNWWRPVTHLLCQKRQPSDHLRAGWADRRKPHHGGGSGPRG